MAYACGAVNGAYALRAIETPRPRKILQRVESMKSLVRSHHSFARACGDASSHVPRKRRWRTRGDCDWMMDSNPTSRGPDLSLQQGGHDTATILRLLGRPLQANNDINY